MKTHIKLKGKAICGQKKRKKPLQFIEEGATATCQRCLHAVRT